MAIARSALAKRAMAAYLTRGHVLSLSAFLALPASLVSLLSPSPAAAAASSPASASSHRADRHPRRGSLIRKPAGVPPEYVFTHNGFFHPSCVVSIQPDEVLGADLVIRGMDGVEHDRIAPCAYPRHALSGARIEAPSPPRGTGRAPSSEPAIGTYDGYIVDYEYDGTVKTGSGLSTKWFVPKAPTNVGAQDIAFFNDIVTSGVILQPVLDFNGESPNQWIIESENCCVGGNDVQSAMVTVSAGDLILGVVTAASCDAAGTCTNWSVTTTDVNTGKSTALTMQKPGGTADLVQSGALETYDVTSCDMFPANGEITFFDNALTDATGQPEPETYELNILASPPIPAGFPTTCGYTGSTSGNSYTLVFGSSPTPFGDGGALDDGGDAGLSVVDGGGVADAGHGAAGGDDGSVGADAATVDAGDDAGTDSPSPIDGGGLPGDDSGGGLGLGDGSPAQSGSSSSSPSSGCGCRAAGSERGSGGVALAIGFLVLGAGLRRRASGSGRGGHAESRRC